MKKALMIIGGVVLGLIVLAVAVFGIVSLTSKKMKCTSSMGNITIMYNDKEVVGYTAQGMDYDLDAQQEYSKLIGIEEYLDEFETWFEINTRGGTCER